MQDFKVIFYLRKQRANKEGQCPIYIRLNLNHEVLDVGSTYVSVFPSYWNNRKMRCMGKDAQSALINNKLDVIEVEYKQIFRRYEYQDNLSLDLIKTDYKNGLAKTKNKTSFLEFFDKYVEESKEEVGISHVKATYTRYALTRTIFGEFIKTKYKRNDIYFNELNYNVIHDFERYLHVDKAYGNNNTLMKKMRVLKTVIISARKRGLLENDPFTGYKIHFDPTDRGFLTDEEVSRLMKKEFPIKRLEVVRDIFIFSCFTGLAYIDVSNLTSKNIVVLDNKKWIMTKRQKTNVPSNILLLSVPEAIIEKYKNADTNGRLLPICTNQRMNSYLKEIGSLCGIEKNLTFHLARHTFATLALSKGVPVESVSKMLGHTNIKTTQIYARVTNKKIEHDMLKLADKLDKFSL